MRKRYRILFMDEFHQPYRHKDFWTAKGAVKFLDGLGVDWTWSYEFLKWDRQKSCYVKIAYSTGVGW